MAFVQYFPVMLIQFNYNLDNFSCCVIADADYQAFYVLKNGWAKKLATFSIHKDAEFKLNCAQI